LRFRIERTWFPVLAFADICNYHNSTRHCACSFVRTCCFVLCLE
jgi:hypothetical protein